MVLLCTIDRKYFLRSITEIQVDLYAERLRDGGPDRPGLVGGTSALNAHAEIRSSKLQHTRELVTRPKTIGVGHVFWGGRTAPTHMAVGPVRPIVCSCRQSSCAVLAHSTEPYHEAHLDMHAAAMTPDGNIFHQHCTIVVPLADVATACAFVSCSCSQAHWIQRPSREYLKRKCTGNGP